MLTAEQLAALEDMAKSVGAEGLAHDTAGNALLKGIKDGLADLMNLVKASTGKVMPGGAAGGGAAAGGADAAAPPEPEEPETEPAPDTPPAYDPMNKGGNGEPEFVEATKFVQDMDKRLKRLEDMNKSLQTTLDKVLLGQGQQTAALAGVLVPLSKAVAEGRIAATRAATIPAVVEENRVSARRIALVPPPVLPAEITPAKLSKALQTRILDEETLRRFKAGPAYLPEGKHAELTTKIAALAV
jgi:hypothetical protein